MKILLDTDFLFALLVETDANHKKARILAEKIDTLAPTIFITNFVLAETATVLSYKASQKQALDFLNSYENLLHATIFEVDKTIEDTAWKIFKEQTKNKTSFIDCANLAVLEKYNLNKIASFDGFYPKEILFVY